MSEGLERDGASHCGDLVFMVLDVHAQSDGEMHVWGSSQVHGSVLVRIADYCPYFYIPCPVAQEEKGDVRESWEAEGAL